MGIRSTAWAGVLCAVAGMGGLVPAAAAETAVLVEAGHERLRDDVQWLVDRGVLQLSTSSWPMPLSALEAALAARRTQGLAAGDLHALAAVEREVARLRAPTSLGVTLQANSDSVPAMEFAAPVRARASAGAWVQASGEVVAGKLQVQRLHRPLTSRQVDTNLEGSYVATQWNGQVLYAGQLAHWWGPGQDGSLIWSNAGTAIPGVGLRRGSERPFETPWLSWLGPWSYEAFVGRMQHNVQVPGTRVFGLRLHIAPAKGLELGASRMIQWGGAGAGNGGSALLDAMLGRSNDAGRAPNNEIAGFDLRYALPIQGNPLAVYGQLIGEDETGLRPSKYIGLMGAQFKHLWGNTRWQWHVESADTMTRRLWDTGTGEPRVAYTHGYYRDGMYHEGLPIGHFMGGDGRVDSIGVSVVPLNSANDLRYSVRLLKASVNESGRAINLAFPASDDLTQAEYSVSWKMKGFTAQPMNLRAGLTTIHRERNGNDASLRLGVELPLK